MADHNANPDTAPEDQAHDDLADGSVDKIRDIIFGRTMRDYERRFSQLEQRISEDNRRLSTDLAARFEKLEAHIKAEFAAQSERLAAERRERVDALDEQRAELSNASRALTDKITDVDTSLTTAAQAIRTQLHEQSAEHIAKLTEARQELLDRLRAEADRLSHEKMARTELAALLQSLALEVGGDGSGAD